MSATNVSRPLSNRDKLTVLAVGVFVIGVVMLMRMDTASWVFKYEDHFIEVNENALPPKLDFKLEQIGGTAAVINLSLENILLVEFCTADDRRLAKGHAHIFLDGKKQGSFFIMQHKLEDLSKGVHTITVSINQPPSHKILSWQGTPLSVTKTIHID